MLKDKWRTCSELNLQVRLRNLKTHIKDWNTNVNGCINKKIQNLEKEQFALDEEGATSQEKERINLELEQCYKIKSDMLKQKARIKWHLEGDKNSKFFHRVVKHKWKKNQIIGINWKSSWISRPADLKEAFFDHFSSFFNQSYGGQIFKLGNLPLNKLSEAQASAMVELFSEEELETALQNSSSNKAPGPDGISAGSLKKIWSFIKTDVLECLRNFQKSNLFPKGMNSSFIALIPKKKLVSEISDFRPISLINSCMKLCTKMMANRLRKVLPDLVAEVQTAFIGGRQITDGIMIAREIVHSLKRRQCEGLILKLDFEKAFDSVEWNFLFHLLSTLNFDSKWISWLRGIFESMRISVLVNGSPTKEFSAGRGLRQGDPVSPLLFNLVGEVLHSMLEKAAEFGIIEGIRISSRAEQLTHLQFADDTIIFLKNDTNSVRGVRTILQCFQVLTGLKINFQKSTLHCFDEDPGEEHWKQILGCSIGTCDITYLGANTSASPSNIKFWDPL